MWLYWKSRFDQQRWLLGEGKVVSGNLGQSPNSTNQVTHSTRVER